MLNVFEVDENISSENGFYIVCPPNFIDISSMSQRELPNRITINQTLIKVKLIEVNFRPQSALLQNILNIFGFILIVKSQYNFRQSESIHVLSRVEVKVIQLRCHLHKNLAILSIIRLKNIVRFLIIEQRLVSPLQPNLNRRQKRVSMSRSLMVHAQTL